MQATDHGDDVELARSRQRHTHGDFVGLRAGHSEVHDLEIARRVGCQQLRKLNGPGIGVPGRFVQEGAGHFSDDLGQFGVRVAEHHAHHAGGKIVILIVVHIDEPGALGRLEDDARRVAPAEHALGVAGLEVGVHVRESKRILHGHFSHPPRRVCLTT